MFLILAFFFVGLVFCSFVSISFLVFWLKWPRVLVTGKSSDPVGCLHWCLLGLGCLELAWPLVKPRSGPMESTLLTDICCPCAYGSLYYSIYLYTLWVPWSCLFMLFRIHYLVHHLSNFWGCYYGSTNFWWSLIVLVIHICVFVMGPRCLELGHL